ncbi:MAG: tetratricopeptide repeat protein [Candidatus Omnitrophica bacterium]|nr:tetratricopeptide repeat protein [Candidatus Omnitrophota bacterium]
MSAYLKNFLASILSFTFLVFFPSNAFAQEIDKALWLFQHENYEEALPLFQELRAQDPQSAQTAFYLGLTYKKLQDYLAAIPELEAAATLQPPAKNALIELIDLLYQCDKINEAKLLLARAKQESDAPAQVAFLNGLVLLKEGKDIPAALQSFETAERLDPALTKIVEYQKAIAHIQLKNYTVAKNTFQGIVTQGPGSDLARFADEYIEELTRREESAKPFHGSVGYAIQYDDNVTARPLDDAFVSDADKKKDWRHVFTTYGDYIGKVTERLSIKTGYSFYRTKYNEQGFYDLLSVSVPVQPIIAFEKAAVSFPLQYSYTTVDDRTYLKTISAGNTNNIMLRQDTMLQTQLQFNHKDYDWAVLNPDDNRCGDEYLFALGGYRFFGRKLDGFFNLRYALNYEDTKGSNWGYLGNRATITAVIPLNKKLRWNFVADYCNKAFRKDNTTYNQKRRDNIYTVSNLLAYRIFENTELQLEHIWIYDDSSIGAYKYRKNVFGLGVKYTF